jgi:hypothetical protein
MAWDVDGTIMRHRSRAGAWSTRSEAERNILNDEDMDGTVYEIMQNSGDAQYMAWIFPELRTVTHYFLNQSAFAGGTFTLEYSTDTTDGSDGTWTSVGAVSFHVSLVQPYFRSALIAITVNSGNPVKGIRILHLSNTSTDYNMSWLNVHWYGSKQTHAGLAFWDPTNDVAALATAFDFGDVAQGSVSSKTFRVKNNHGSQTANDIIVGAVDVTGTMELEFSIGGGAYLPDLDIGDLAPGVISGVITARRTVPTNETVRLQAVRLSAIPTSWT